MVFRRVRKIAKMGNQLRHVSLNLSVFRPHGATRLPLDKIFMQFDILVFF